MQLTKIDLTTPSFEGQINSVPFEKNSRLPTKALATIALNSLLGIPIRHSSVVDQHGGVVVVHFLPWDGQQLEGQKLEEGNAVEETQAANTALVGMSVALAVPPDIPKEVNQITKTTLDMKNDEFTPIRRLEYDLIDYDPVTAIPLVTLGGRTRSVFRSYLLLLIGWQRSFTFEQQMQWGNVANEVLKALLSNIMHEDAIAKMSDSEKGYLSDWLHLSIANPDIGASLISEG